MNLAKLDKLAAEYKRANDKAGFLADAWCDLTGDESARLLETIENDEFGIVHETADFWVKQSKAGFEVMRSTSTHSERVAIFGRIANARERAIDDCNRRQANNLRKYDHSDFEQNATKYALFTTARIATDDFCDPDIRADYPLGKYVSVKLLGIRPNTLHDRMEPVYIIDGGRFYLYAGALADFCI